MFASAARIYLEDNLREDMYSKNFAGQREKLEIKAFGQAQSIELIPYIAKQLEIESKNILVSDPYTSKPYYYEINDNNECEQRIVSTPNPLALFEIIFDNRHFDIKVPDDLYQPFVANNDYDSLSGFSEFASKYTVGGSKQLHVITDTAMIILNDKLNKCTKPVTPAVHVPQALPKAKVKPGTPAVHVSQALPKAKISQQDTNIPTPRLSGRLNSLDKVLDSSIIFGQLY